MTDEREFNRLLRPLYIVLGLVIVLTAAGLTYGGFTTASLKSQNRELQRQADAIIAARDAGRRRECHRDNDQFERALVRVRDVWNSYVTYSNKASGHDLPPQAKAQLEPFLKSQEAAVRKEWAPRAPRPCDPRSIDAYYAAQEPR